MPSCLDFLTIPGVLAATHALAFLSGVGAYVVYCKLRHRGGNASARED